MSKLSIKKCPTCGSDKIKLVCKEWKSATPAKKCSVSSLEYYECPDCGEELYDREAMRAIEAASPAFKRLRSHNKIAA